MNKDYNFTNNIINVLCIKYTTNSVLNNLKDFLNHVDSLTPLPMRYLGRNGWPQAVSYLKHKLLLKEFHILDLMILW